MNKKLGAIALLGASAVVLAGCSTGSTATDGGTPEPAELRVWLVGTDTPQDARDYLVKTFEDENPGSTLTIEEQQWTGLVDKLTTSLSSSDSPDVVEMGNTQAAAFTSSGALLDLSDIEDARTGIAAGFVNAGRLWRGAYGTAGEVGHICVDPRGPLCKCGQRGCIEAFSGGGALAERWGRPGALPVRDVFDGADAGDPVALALRDGFAFGVAAAVRVIVLSTDVESVVLGGGVSALGDRMLSRVVTELEARAAASPFLRSLHLADRVELLPPGSPAAALGAALLGADTHEQETVPHG